MRNISSKIFALLAVVSAIGLVTPAQAQVLWAVGRDDGGWPVGNGGGPDTTFVQENGVNNGLPGTPTSPETDQQADNDYYFAGDYSFLIPSVLTAYGASPHQSVWFQPTKKRRSEHSPEATLICATTSILQTRSYPPTWFRLLSNRSIWMTRAAILTTASKSISTVCGSRIRLSFIPIG